MLRLGRCPRQGDGKGARQEVLRRTRVAYEDGRSPVRLRAAPHERAVEPRKAASTPLGSPTYEPGQEAGMNGRGKSAFEYIVVGCGGIGSAAVYWLSREAGSEVLGLEQFHLGHDRGGSEDHSRIIRLSYHDRAYTTLTPHTYESWSEIEDESGIQLVFETGGLDLESVEDEPTYINHYAGAMAAAGIPYEELSALEVMDRFPQFTLDERVLGVYQKEAGFVDAGKANAVHIALARARGATVLDEAPAYGVRPVKASRSTRRPGPSPPEGSSWPLERGPTGY